MNISNNNRFDFNFDENEKKTINNTIDIINNIINIMDQRGYTYIRTSYLDSPTDYDQDGLQNISDTLEDLIDAWEIGFKK